ncbi:MAG: TRAP transporter small permease [Synergistaceae bacterium]|nr:TRAP transporter small permease [Synergistaceae bacterium]
MKSFLDRLEEHILVAGLAVLVFIVCLQVTMRYFFHTGLTWSEEVARFLFLWLVWLGAAYAAKKRAHLRIEAFTQKLSPAVRRKADFIALIIWIAFSAFLTWKGTELTMILIKRRQISPILEIRMAWAYAAVPVGAGLMFIRLLAHLKAELTGTTEVPR